MNYKDLPKRWQEVIDEAIDKVDGGSKYAIKVAWREVQAQFILPGGFWRFLFPLRRKSFVNNMAIAYGYFADGWVAALQKQAWLRGDDMVDPNAKWNELLATEGRPEDAEVA